MRVFISTMLYALGKDLGLEGAGAEFARQLAEPDINSLPVTRTISRVRSMPIEVGVYSDNSATCIAKARSRAFHAAESEPLFDVWLSCDDDVEAPRSTLALLLEAVEVNTPRIVFVPTTLRGNPGMASVKWGKGPAQAIGATPEALYPVSECGAGMFAVNRAALSMLGRSFQHLAFRDHDGVRKLGLFLETIDGGDWVGEDIAFCRRAALVGVELLGLARGMSRHGDDATLDLWSIRPTVTV